MNKKPETLDKKALKARILEELDKTAQDISAWEKLVEPISPENAIGRISRMDAINNKTINEASLRQARDKMKQLQTALEKIADKDFGICIKCKRIIPIGRIMLMPYTKKCVNCA